MFEVGLESVCEEISDAFASNNLQRVDQLLWPALDQFSDIPQLWFHAGNLSFKIGRAALAASCFERCMQLDDNPLVLSNLGASYRRLNRNEDGERVLHLALDRHPDYEPALVNLGAMYVNEGCPEKGIPHLERAVELGREKGRMETGAEWNLALLYLEAARFGEGFDLYRGGYGAERQVRKYAYRDVAEPAVLDRIVHAASVETGLRPTLIVHAEQGIGDELMAATIFNDAIEDYEIVFECHPRLEKLHRNSTWARKLKEQGRPVRIYPTRKDEWIGWPVQDEIRAEYKCAIFDLAAYYRRDLQSFLDSWRRTGPTYGYNVAERDAYREQLERMAQGRPIVGLATHGGVMSTARQYRTLRMPDIERLFTETDAFFVGVDYDDMTPMAMHLAEKHPGRYHWPAAIVQHWDFDHTAALLGATDLNVMVCQSAAHMSAAMGLPTRVLVPRGHAWRYAQTDSDRWYWYPAEQVALCRQTENWTIAIGHVIDDVKGLQHG